MEKSLQKERIINEKDDILKEQKAKLEIMLKENQKLVETLDNNTIELKKYRDLYNSLNQNYENYIDELKKQFEVQKEVSYHCNFIF